MTEQEMLQAVVEAAGECWHTFYIQPFVCDKCGVSRVDDNHDYPPRFITNPSPTDLNALFRYARKFGDLGAVTFTYEGDMEEEYGYVPVQAWIGINGKDYTEIGKTEAQALLHALYSAVKEKV